MGAGRRSTDKPPLPADGPVVFGKRLQDRVVVVASAVFLAAIVVAVLLVDHRHQRMVMERAALEARALRMQLSSRVRIAPVVDSEGVRVVVPAETSAIFFDPGRIAYITANGSLLWKSAGDVPDTLLRASAEEKVQQGLVFSSEDGEKREYYGTSQTVPYRLVRPVVGGPAKVGREASRHRYYRYPVTYHVLLDYAPYRREIVQFRTDMAVVVLIAMLLLFAATRIAIHRQLRPLARVTGDVSRLSGNIGEAVVQERRDPEEIRLLAERINQFLVALDETRRWEQETHGRIRAALEDLKDTMLAEEVSQGGFMHSLNHMLNDVLLMDFRTVSEEDKATLRESVAQMRDMLDKKLNLLLRKRVAGPVAAIDLVRSVERFRALMASRFADRAFVIEPEDTSLPVCVLPEDLSEMIGNLLRNAGHWSHGTVLLGLSRVDGMARITIEDDGPGFPQEDGNLLLEWRSGAGSRSQGHGIGLPYVNSLARGYGGRLQVAVSPKLGGAKTVLDLPLSGTSPRGEHEIQDQFKGRQG